MTSEPLLKVLTSAGIGSRRKMADAIRQGRAEINGEVVEDFRHPVNTDTDRISLDGQPVYCKPEQTVYIMLHKPKGIISTVKDERHRKTVLDIIPKKYRRQRLYPVGRLDKDTTGLLLLTNNGELTYRLTHPRFEHKKEYWVYIKSKLRANEKKKLEQGLALEKGVTYPATVREIKSSPPYNYSITIHEGKKRQVRHMFEALGHRVLALKRVCMGNLSLGDLKEGDMRNLSAQEINHLLSNIAAPS